MGNITPHAIARAALRDLLRDQFTYNHSDHIKRAIARLEILDPAGEIAAEVATEREAERAELVRLKAEREASETPKDLAAAE